MSLLPISPKPRVTRKGPIYHLNLGPRILYPIELPTKAGNYDDTKIIDNYLYLGNYINATDTEYLLARNIKKVLNVSDDCPVPEELYKSLGITCLNFPIKDHSDANIKTIIPSALLYIASAISSKQPILVHCKMGFSRSPTIVIAYLMQYGYTQFAGETQMSKQCAFDYVKARRALISPNIGFCMALSDHENNLGIVPTSEQDQSAFSTPKTTPKQMSKI